MLPMSWVTKSAWSAPTASITPATSPPCVFLSYPAGGLEESPSPRRSGTMTVWSAASRAASGAHMSPVVPKPCSNTTAGPLPPTRVWIVAPLASISRISKAPGKDIKSSCMSLFMLASCNSRSIGL